MKKLCILLFCLLSLPAFAAAKKKEPNDLGVTAQDCAALAEYQPAADLDYKPGVDVHGKPVVEADIAPSVIKAPEVYSFPLTVDVARRMGLNPAQGQEEETPIGIITVDKNGVKFNGQPLEGDALTALKAICAAQKTAPAPQKPVH